MPNTDQELNEFIDSLDEQETDGGTPDGILGVISAPEGYVLRSWHDVQIWDVQQLKVGDVIGEWVITGYADGGWLVSIANAQDSESVFIEPQGMWNALTALYGADPWSVRRMFSSYSAVVVADVPLPSGPDDYDDGL